MGLEDLDFCALIDQMWGSEDNLKAYLDSEVPRLCSRICGADAPVPIVKVTYPPLQGNAVNGVAEVKSGRVVYQLASENAPATIYMPAIYAGYKAKLPQFIAFQLVHHWEVLGAIGEQVLDYSQAPSDIIKHSGTSMSEEDFRELYSPTFLAKAVKVARDFEISLGEFLFPKISLTVHLPRPEDETSGSN